MKNNKAFPETAGGTRIRIPELKISGMPGEGDTASVALQVSQHLDRAGLPFDRALQIRLSRKIASQVQKSVEEKTRSTRESRP